MRPVQASIVVRGRAVEAEQLWYDKSRWASWVDGFGHLVALSEDWPLTGSTLQWDSPPGGSGRNRERVTRYEPRLGQTLEIENERFTGVRRVIFEPGLEETRVTLELALEPKLPLPAMERLLLRRRVGESLRRTVTRFSVELAAERQFGRRR
jgi:hypothetical protein